MTADRSPKALGAKVNECLKLGIDELRANVRFWVLAAATIATEFDQPVVQIGSFNVRI